MTGHKCGSVVLKADEIKLDIGRSEECTLTVKQFPRCQISNPVEQTRQISKKVTVDECTTYRNEK